MNKAFFTVPSKWMIFRPQNEIFFPFVFAFDWCEITLSGTDQ